MPTTRLARSRRARTRGSRRSPQRAPNGAGTPAGTSPDSPWTSPTPSAVHEGRLEDVQALAELCVIDRQRHQRANDVRVETGAQEQEATVARCANDGLDDLGSRLLRRSVAHELDRAHRTDAPGVADDPVLRGQISEAFADDLADPRGASQDPITLDDLDRRDRRGARDRVPAKRASE